MNAAAVTSGPEEPPVLIFQEDTRPQTHWRLGAMIFVALLGHAASFYIFQVAYTPNGSLFPPPARVMLLPLDQPQNAPLAHWLALTDPTLATQSLTAADGAVIDGLNLRYAPSYDAASPAFKALNPAATTDSISPAPRPRPLGQVIVSAAAVGKSDPPGEFRSGFVPLPSRLVLGPGLDALVSHPLPPVQFTGSAGIKPLEPTVFLVGIRPEGGMPLLFPIRQVPASTVSAGADEADEFARDYLTRLVFRPAGTADGGVFWSRAAFYWGSDAAPDIK